MQSNVILGVLLTLLDKQKVTSRELAEKFEISTRSVFRYLNVLSEAGVPIYSNSGPNGGICIQENFKLRNLYFTKDEFSRIINSVKSYDAMVDDALNREILDKLLALSQLKDQNYVLQTNQLFLSSTLSTSNKDKVSVLERAIAQQTVCRLAYHSRKGEKTTREIEPHALAVNGDLWYVYAFCHMRNEFRLFKISRIYQIQPLTKHFERRPFDLSQPKELNTDAVCGDVLLKIAPTVLGDVEEWLGVESIQETENGIFAETKLPLDAELKSKILSFGDAVEVLQPKELIADLKATVARLNRLYS